MTIVLSTDRRPVNPDLSMLGVLVDRSGSIAGYLDEMQSGLDGFIQTQVKQPGLLDITLAQFDHAYEVVWTPRRVRNGRPPGTHKLVPRGGTALYDAVGRFVVETREVLATRPISKRSSKVIICIVTDGQDTCSAEWTQQTVKALVDRQTADGWQFIYLGPDTRGAAAFGIQTAMTLDTAAAARSFTAMSDTVTAARRALPPGR